jgi:pimeloyl-ACP methyl ester carboxylesterase
MAASAQTSSAQKPTVVLVHGAWADASSWNGVIQLLHRQGYTVIAAANPLRSLKGDAASVNALVRGVSGPVVLVGHSYGGSVITEAAEGLDNVKALVYVAGYAPDSGESVITLTGRFPGSTVEAALAQPVPLAEGGVDLYIQQGKFHAQFAADVPAAVGDLLGAEQRPVTQAALTDANSVAGWKTLPSWFIYGTGDLAIPPAAHAFMANRANSRKTVVVSGASHVLMVTHPDEVAALIEQAAQVK